MQLYICIIILYLIRLSWEFALLTYEFNHMSLIGYPGIQGKIDTCPSLLWTISPDIPHLLFTLQLKTWQGKYYLTGFEFPLGLCNSLNSLCSLTKILFHIHSATRYWSKPALNTKKCMTTLSLHIYNFMLTLSLCKLYFNCNYNKFYINTHPFLVFI